MQVALARQRQRKSDSQPQAQSLNDNDPGISSTVVAGFGFKRRRAGMKKNNIWVCTCIGVTLSLSTIALFVPSTAAEVRVPALLYLCPEDNEAALEQHNFATNVTTELYLPTLHKLEEQWDDFLQHFRDVNSTYVYDAWDYNYATVKSKLTNLKLRYLQMFVNETKIARKNNDPIHIYESASGIGMGLLMNVELLHQHFGVQNITVHGTEFFAQSVRLGRRLFDPNSNNKNNNNETTKTTTNFVVAPPGVKLGQYCRGDASNLSHVPSNAFDLVFTGYITPLVDPLKTNNTDRDYWIDCKNDEDGVRRMNQMQEDWFNSWISEMVRVAKPGALVVVEQVIRPKCEEPNDWGGVTRDFFARQAPIWGAKVLEMVDDVFFETGRYNVFLRKLEKQLDGVVLILLYLLIREKMFYFS